jgi:G:T-mismatch repair DNA endonuclease (very short patch repair protein)
MNEIRLYGSKDLIVKIYKEGRTIIYLFGNNKKMRATELSGSRVEIKCNECESWKLVKFYRGLIQKPYICQSCNKKGTKNPFYGKSHTDETKTKIIQNRRSYIGKGNPFYGKSHTGETRIKISNTIIENEICKGDRNPFYGKTHTEETRKILHNKTSKWAAENRDHYVKMGIASVCSQMKGKKTSIEKTVENILEQYQIPHRYNFILDKKYQFDFLIGDSIILEVHGDFWHANPLYYSDIDPNKIKLTERQHFKIDRDAEKSKYAIEKGYEIFIIWETEVKKEDYRVIELIKENL